MVHKVWILSSPLIVIFYIRIYWLILNDILNSEQILKILSYYINYTKTVSLKPPTILGYWFGENQEVIYKKNTQMSSGQYKDSQASAIHDAY